ncbi:DUF2971 domain-containing protein [Azotobacter vinelandii]|uniref:DUF2971 domain-containing protein n=1 Tax=Azotobacter vinelandii TaxID=354 RepID=UPI0026652A34|nr:DUF2971 domain-containing protein [Azotobacter vinelandii]WKN22001.1 DUF2971 domain-containing protein [Azotobacter vinelandii]
MSIERLYKYGRINEYSEQVFSGSTIWQASAASLNDPFECTPSFVFTHEPDKIMAQLVRTLRKNNPSLTHDLAVAEATAIYLQGRHRNPAMWEALWAELIHMYRHKVGLYCLTERNDSILMWSHYAADHAGYCLEFEATDYTPVFGAAQRVSYTDAYPEINLYNTPSEDKVALSFLTKFTDWSYEKEWRIIDHDAGPGSREYPSELLKSVIFGLRMKDEHKVLIKKWLGARRTPVRLYQAGQGKDRFEVTFTEVS